MVLNQCRFRAICPALTIMFAVAFTMIVSDAALAQQPDFLWQADAAHQPKLTNEPVRISQSAQDQVAALMHEKASRTSAQLKLDSQLVYALKLHRNDRLLQAVPRLRATIVALADGRYEVDIKARVSDALLAKIRQLGGNATNVVAAFDAIRASLPLNALEPLAGDPDVRWIAPAVYPQANTDSEGDVTHGAQLARQVMGLTGQGMKVAVLSTSVFDLALLQSEGLLPAVTVLSGQSGTGYTQDAEGTAMLEIVHDLAPQAALYFATAFPTEAQMAQNILNLRSQTRCDVIIDDMTYLDETPFQDDLIARAINTVTQNGALYFSSAGNNDNFDSAVAANSYAQTWEGDFVNSGYVVTYNGQTELLTSFGSNYGNPFGGPNGNPCQGVQLWWSDPLGGSDNDYDLFVLDPTGYYILGASMNPQNGSQDPYEAILSNDPNPANWFPYGSFALVGLYSGRGRFLHLSVAQNSHNLLGTFTNGAIRGHNGAAAAVSVAAADAMQAYPSLFSASDVVESFSSDGPRRIFYYPNGTPITPGNYSSTGGALLAKPDYTAADDVTTDVPGFAPFFGTSAAAPHAGAIAALLKSYDPALSYNLLVAPNGLWDFTAWKIMYDGYDWNQDAGMGLISADDAAFVLVASSMSKTIAVSPSSVIGGASATGTITFSPPTPPDGLQLTLSSDSSAASVQQTLNVKGGVTSVNFPITTSNVATTTTAHITATNGITSATGALTITPATTATLSSVSASPNPVIGGNSGATTVNLTAAASSAVSVSLSLSSSAVSAPSKISIPAGHTSGTANFTSVPVVSDTSVTLTAKLNGVSKTTHIKVLAPILQALSLTPNSVKGGKSVTCKVTLSGKAAQNLTVKLINTNPAAHVPTSVTIAKGNSTASVTITTKTPSGSGNATGNVTATLGKTSMSQKLTVTH